MYGIFLVGMLTILSDFCHDKTKGFAIGKLAHSFNNKEEVFPPGDSLEERKEIKEALEQPFQYLKKGKYCFAFASEDGQYVLKFFQRSPIEPPFWANLSVVKFFFPSACERVIAKKKKQKELNFKSYEMAFTHFKKQTGILGLHVYPSLCLENRVTLYDNIKVKHEIDINKYCFILQKKAAPFCLYFKQLMSLEPNKAYALLTQFALLLKERADQGVSDADLSPRYNLGVIDGKIVPFDLDGLRFMGSCYNKQQRMLQDAKKMFLWLDSTYPEASCFLEKEINVISQQ